MALRRRYALCVLLGLPWAAVGAPAGQPDCTPGPARAETLEGIGQRGELRFGSGRRAILDSLRWPEADETARARLGLRVGRALLVTPRGLPDRWDRERVDAQAEDGTDLAGDLVEAGLAPVDPGEADELCRPALRLVEDMARRRRLGLWRDDPPSAEDGAALRRLAGHYAVVEGRIRHVGERNAWTYLDFAARGADGLTVTVTKRTWRRMAARGLSADSLHDRRVRVRGFIEIRRGPVIAAATPEVIEVLDEGAPIPHDARSRDDSGVRR